MCLKTFEVSFDMKTSQSFVVDAKTESEAKHLAFVMFEKRRNKKASYDIDVYAR